MYKLICPANEAKPGQPLSPALGQIQIKVQDFITEFNKQALDYQNGLPMNCRIKKLPQPTKFDLYVLPPSWWQLTWGLSEDRQLSLSQFYDCFLYRYQRFPTPIEVKTVLTSLKSARLKINLKLN